MRMRRTESILICVDIQERLAAAMRDRTKVLTNAVFLLHCARKLHVPALASEQYPQGLGPSEAGLIDALGASPRIEKIAFSCLKEKVFCDELTGLGRKQAIVLGMEAHVCVLQTVLDLLEQGYQAFVVTDAVTSRFDEDKEVALRRMEQAGAQLVTTEMVAFEWLVRASDPDFKWIVKAIKARAD